MVKCVSLSQCVHPCQCVCVSGCVHVCLSSSLTCDPDAPGRACLPAQPPYLGADSHSGNTEGEDGHVLHPAQPVHGDLGAGCPLDHGDVVFPATGDMW